MGERNERAALLDFLHALELLLIAYEVRDIHWFRSSNVCCVLYIGQDK